MATVRQSITALYEEAQRSAVEGAPMLAVLQSDAAGPDALPDRADADDAVPLPATAIAARFEELRRLAELEAGPAAEPSETPATDETRFDAPNDPLAGIDLSAGFGDRIHNDPADDATSAASYDVDRDGGEPVPEKPSDATPTAQAVTGIETRPSLPEEPPAPASDAAAEILPDKAEPKPKLAKVELPKSKPKPQPEKTPAAKPKPKPAAAPKPKPVPTIKPLSKPEPPAPQRSKNNDAVASQLNKMVKDYHSKTCSEK